MGCDFWMVPVSSPVVQGQMGVPVESKTTILGVP